jgi:type IV secretion system protein VirB10
MPDDVHASKLSPDDPRLRLRRPVARTLRTAPLVVLLACLLGAILLAIALAFQPPTSAGKAKTEPSGAPPAPIVPEAIRNASAIPKTAAHPWPEAGTVRVDRDARMAGQEDAKRRAVEDQNLKAQGAGILFDTPGGAGEHEQEVEPAHAPSLAGAALLPSAAGMASADSDPNLQLRKNAFLDGPGARTATALTATLQHPRSPYELKAGTILPTVLVTGINSDLPGPVIGQVRENVYDTVSGNWLLVPQGSRLLAQYDSMVSWGQERVLLCWNRLILPNGDSLDLPCMPAADLAGAAGLTDQVDEHWFRIIKGAAVASLLAATAQGVAGNVVSVNPTVPQMWAGGAAGNINQVGQQLTRRDLNVQPTITVRPGYAINVIVTKDIVLPPYPDSLAVGVRR